MLTLAAANPAAMVIGKAPLYGDRFFVTPHATPFDAFVYQPAAEMDAMIKSTDGKQHSKVVVDHEDYFIEYVTRVINTNAEAHNHWYDYIHVLEGEGSITYGGTQDGGKDTGMGEIRGGKQAISTVALNWYLNRNMRLMFQYQHVDIDRLSSTALSATTNPTTPSAAYPNIGQEYDTFAIRTQLRSNTSEPRTFQ